MLEQHGKGPSTVIRRAFAEQHAVERSQRQGHLRVRDEPHVVGHEVEQLHDAIDVVGDVFGRHFDNFASPISISDRRRVARDKASPQRTFDGRGIEEGLERCGELRIVDVLIDEVGQHAVSPVVELRRRQIARDVEFEFFRLQPGHWPVERELFLLAEAFRTGRRYHRLRRIAAASREHCRQEQRQHNGQARLRLSRDRNSHEGRSQRMFE